MINSFSTFVFTLRIIFSVLCLPFFISRRLSRSPFSKPPSICLAVAPVCFVPRGSFVVWRSRNHATIQNRFNTLFPFSSFYAFIICFYSFSLASVSTCLRSSDYFAPLGFFVERQTISFSCFSFVLYPNPKNFILRNRLRCLSN